MTYKEKYFEAKRALKKLITERNFENFNSRDLFYLLDEHSKGIVFFSETLLNDSFGLQFFLDDVGVNYLHDAFTTENGFSINHFFSDSILLCMMAKKDLTIEDIKFLKTHKIRILSENNLIPYSFREGYGLSYLSSKELDRVITYTYYLMSLIKNEFLDILEASKNEKITIAAFDTKQMTYEVRYSRMVDLEHFPRYKKANQEFIDEFSNSTYIDDVCHIAHCYLPIEKTMEEPYPSVLLAYYENKEDYFYRIIPCKPNKITDYIFGFMDESFKEYGLPTGIKINQRKIFSHTYKSLKGLHIDIQFQRENEVIDNILYDIIDKEVNRVGELVEMREIPSFVS